LQGSPEERIWERDPLGAFARPATPCDLCEIFPVGTGDDCPPEVTMALLQPPFGENHEDRNTFEILPTQTTNVKVKKLTFAFTCLPLSHEGADAVSRQATRAICAEALHAANLEVMRALRDAMPGPHKQCGIDGLLGIASDLCASHPYPQLPTGTAFLLPSPSLARLLSDPETRVSLHTGAGVQRAFVNGVEAIAYDAQQAHGEPMPTYVVPRGCAIGLAISKVAFHMRDRDDHIDFKARCNMGAAVISDNMSSAIA